MAVILKKRTLVLGLALTALAAVLVGLSAGDMEPWAPPASTLKPLSEIEPRRVIWGEFLPLVISEEGSSWYLGESISFTGAEHGITIEADDVTIDLNGFVLSGPGFGNGDGIHVIAGRSGVTILNGTIRSWGDDGVNAEGAFLSRMNGLMLRDNGWVGLYAGSSAVVTECIAVNNVHFGIIADDLSVVRSCVAEGNHSGFAVSSSSITDCVSRNNTDAGFRVGSASSVVRCSATSNGVNGIQAEYANTISDCLAKDNGANGISVHAGNYLLNNTADLNGSGASDGAGIHLSLHSNRVESNNVLSNDRGIDVDMVGNVIVKNSARNNGTNYDIVPGNQIGPIGGVTTSTSPWANIEY